MNPMAWKMVTGAASGLGAAALVDFAAFRSWKSFNDVAAYNWQIAAFRWFQGAVTGVVAALGVGMVE